MSFWCREPGTIFENWAEVISSNLNVCLALRSERNVTGSPVRALVNRKNVVRSGFLFRSVPHNRIFRWMDHEMMEPK